ncbi:MAG: MMPL family transporter [Gaiellaceae bacterium]
MKRLASLVAGRRSKFLVLVFWLIVLGAGAPFASRFERVQKNEPSSFLPAGAESVRVLAQGKLFPSGQVTPAVVVYRDAGGLTGADRKAVSGLRASLNGSPSLGMLPLGPAILSLDRKAALLVVSIRAGGDDKLLAAAVDRVRRAARAGAPRGLVVKVTGPAGYSDDASRVFDGINSTLLLSTTLLVFVLLVLIYRSPVFWILPLASVLFAEVTVRAIGYGLASAGVLINAMTAGILLVLVYGAGTDYALLLTARYREELRRHEDRHEAMRIAIRRAGPAILASSGTVVTALLCLSLARTNTIAGMGPVAAVGVAVAACAMLTLLPALLLVGGRHAFWPFVPRVGSAGEDRRGLWLRLGRWIERRHRAVALAAVLLLGGLTAGVLTLDNNLTTANSFRGGVESVAGQRLLDRSFPAGASAPTMVLVRDRARLAAVRAAAARAPEVAVVGPSEVGAPGARFPVTLRADPYSKRAYRQVRELRDELRATAADAVLVGGPTAEESDLRTAIDRDTKLLVPLVLAVVLLILVLLLRSLAAPLILMATVVLSFFAALGASLLGLAALFDFPGEDPSYAMFCFIFLVALGVDYNIFLMARVREEAQRVPTREAMLRALAVTGSVITSAGIVLAGTFSILAVLPLVALTQVGGTIAFGILLDTFVVRSVLVPALTFELGRRIWWPSRMARRPAAAG